MYSPVLISSVFIKNASLKMKFNLIITPHEYPSPRSEVCIGNSIKISKSRLGALNDVFLYSAVKLA